MQKKKKTTKKPPEKAVKKEAKTEAQKQSSLYKFRRYNKVEGGKDKKARHPKLIVEETETEFGFMGLTEEPKSGHHSNIRLSKNPLSGDSRTAYVRKELRYDIQNNFGKIIENYNLSEQDKIAIIEYIEKRKKKK